MAFGWYAALGKTKNYFGAAAVVVGAMAASMTISHAYAGVPLAHPYWVFAAVLSSFIVYMVLEKMPPNAPIVDKVGDAWMGTMFAFGGSTAAGIHTGPLAIAFSIGTFAGLGAFALFRWISRMWKEKRE